MEDYDAKRIQRYEFAKQLVDGRSVYDIDCRDGIGAKILDNVIDYFGMSFNSMIIDSAKLQYGDPFVGYPIDFRASNLNELSGNMAYRDTVICFDTIEQLRNPEQFLDWCADHANNLVISIESIKFAEALHPMFKSRWKKVEFYTQDGLQMHKGIKDCDGGVFIGVCRCSQ